MVNLMFKSKSFIVLGLIVVIFLAGCTSSSNYQSNSGPGTGIAYCGNEPCPNQSPQTTQPSNSAISEPTTAGSLAPLEAEVNLSIVGTTVSSAHIINRNDYDWTNVKIIANDYYYVTYPILAKGYGDTFYSFDFKDDQEHSLDLSGNGIIHSIKIITDQGSGTFGR